ncbi:hypothetical protein [Novosphingobium terrae]|uniref:hypothetical protein n=1 Tax=Novosphingobium terrae TaxID=2726189 RepID=UPI0019820001|nr:hypothetical protein [Novosphingobium terrae]
MIVKSLTKDPASESMPKDCMKEVIGSLTIVRGITGWRAEKDEKRGLTPSRSRNTWAVAPGPFASPLHLRSAYAPQAIDRNFKRLRIRISNTCCAMNPGTTLSQHATKTVKGARGL